MKLLFVLTHTDLTGVNTFNYTVVKAIKSKYKDSVNIDVLLPYSKNSILSVKLSEYSNVIEQPLNKVYDNVYFNYESDNGLFDKYYTSKKFFFVHGLMCGNNIPTKKYDKVFCFGERSYNYIKAENKELIRNYIDCERFGFVEPNNVCEKILIHSSRDSQILVTPILAAAKEVNAYVSFTGVNFLNKGKTWGIENQVYSSDMVVGYGRCLIESMAMGKAVLLFGVNGGEGVVSSSSFWRNAETNFSGWIDRKLKFDLDEKTIKDLYQEIIKYNVQDILSICDIVKEHFDINKNVDKIL